MSIPTLTPPTDNLYEFVAISGLVLVIAAIAGSLQLQNAIDRDLAALRSDLESGGIAVVPATGPVDLNQVTHIPKADAFLAEFRSAQRTVNTLNWAGLIGFGMMVVGFWFWYRRVQRFQDQIIAAEARDAMSKRGK